MLLFLATLALVACGGIVPGEDTSETSSALVDNARVLGFESTSDWSITSGSIATNTTHSQGSFSIKTSGVTSGSLKSVNMTTLAGVTSTLAFDLRLPTSQPNPTYFGTVELHVSIPSQDVYDSFVGYKLLQPPFLLNSFQTVQFMIPDWIFQKLKTKTYSDLSWKFLLSLPSGNGGIYLDNMRFGSTPTEWPNAVSSASSDTWLAVNHASIQKLKPRVLVLNFDNNRDNATVTSIVNPIIAGLKEGSRPRGYIDAAAPAMLEYQIDKVVDLRDHPPPPGWTKKTSSIYPRRPNPAGFAWGTDYAQFFNSTFAARLGYADPAHPGQFFTLCQLSDMGKIHEVWMVFDPDDGDASAAEILEWAPIYDMNRNKTGNWNQCAGNGCFDFDVPHCGGSLRIGFINSTRGPGCFIHGEGHGMEHKLSEGVSIPSVAPYFKEFADFDLDTRHGLPFPTWYFLPADNPDPPEPNSPCDYIRWTSSTSIEWTNVPKPPVCTVQVPRTPLNPYVPVCGSVHFTPNARRHYDDFNTFVVQSTCQGWRRHEGAGGKDLARNFSLATFSQYNSLVPDCEGGFQVWWRQNMPGYNNPLKNNANQPMLSWFPYLFY